MKKRGSKVEFSADRTAELVSVMRRMMREATHIDIKDIARRAVAQPCSRFWVSEERALDIVYRLQRGEALSAKAYPARRRMYHEINRRVNALRRERPDASIASLVVEVVNSPAPEFYITPLSALTHYYHSIKR